jgi:hypothetical protein
MVEVIKKTYQSDDSMTYTGYGLRSGDFCVEDISLSYPKIKELAELCNRLQVTGDRLREVAEDFVQK